MGHEFFDRLTRLLGQPGSRRAALGALLGTGALGTAATAEAKGNHKRRRAKRQNTQKRRKGADVSAQAADCSNPGPGTNLNGCKFTNDDFSGDDLHGSSMKATIFRDADLTRSDLHGSNAKGASFRNAKLCGADLSSSTLRNANFRDADLTLADLSSSSCNGATFTAGTTFCQTKRCDGSIDNSDCPVSGAVCCADADCPPGMTCVDGLCALQTCTGTTEACPGIAASCGTGDCECFLSFVNDDPEGPPYCVENVTHIFACEDMTGFGECTDSAQCEPGFSCVSSCCNVEGHLPGGFCWPACGNPQGNVAGIASRRSMPAGDAPTSQSVR